jgi:hypothetical protein
MGCFLPMCDRMLRTLVAVSHLVLFFAPGATYSVEVLKWGCCSTRHSSCSHNMYIHIHIHLHVCHKGFA